MARRHRHKNRRDTSRITSSHTTTDRSVVDDVLSVYKVPFPTSVRSPDTSVEDRREWHPSPARLPRSSRRSVVRLVLPKAQRPLTPRVSGRNFSDVQQLQFRAPKHVQICIRRKQRREVIFAKGRGGGGHRRPRRNQWSNVRC